ncbi:MAG: hypothetical protein ACP5K8_08950 [Nitrososphaeria archaeon]
MKWQYARISRLQPRRVSNKLMLSRAIKSIIASPKPITSTIAYILMFKSGRMLNLLLFLLLRKY